MGSKALLFISVFLLSASFSQAQVTLSVGTATGYRGSYNNAVAVNLSGKEEPEEQE